MITRNKSLPMGDGHRLGTCCSENEKLDSCCAGVAADNWVKDSIETVAGPVYRITSTLTREDLFGSFKVRWGIGRMNYSISPGLYAIGNPDNSSPVMVSANYKLSFDSLRRELCGFDLWILVIDTKGINVWCAAGKGTFSTDEVSRMVNITRLEEIVSHRTLILPQLSAPGVSAGEVSRCSGFKVIFGPVRAADIPAFLRAGNRAEPAMRRTQFTLRDRLILAPVELTSLTKPLALFAFLLLILNLITLPAGSPFPVARLLGQTLADFAPFLVAVLTGAVIVPILLPYIPGRALSWKGLVAGLIWAVAYRWLFASQPGWLQTTSYFLIIPAITAFLGMNFSGSTTYTSLSGVIKEMRVALPLMVASAGLGLIALIAAYFT